MKKKIISIACFSSLLLMMSGCGTLGRNTEKSTNTSNDAELTDVLGSVLGSVINSSSSVSESDLVGKWNYKSSACSFKTENLLLKAGGETIAKNAEAKLDKGLQSVGIKNGVGSITFKSDKTFTMVIANKTTNGTFSYNASACKITFFFLEGLNTATATISRSNTNEIQLLFESNKLYSFLKTVGKVTTNSSLSTAISLLNSYDGILAGMTLRK